MVPFALMSAVRIVMLPTDGIVSWVLVLALHLVEGTPWREAGEGSRATPS